MSKSEKRNDRFETHYTPKELAAAICVDALIAVLRNPDDHWLEDASPNYRRRALNAIEKLAITLGDENRFDFILPERNYRDE